MHFLLGIELNRIDLLFSPDNYRDQDYACGMIRTERPKGLRRSAFSEGPAGALASITPLLNRDLFVGDWNKPSTALISVGIDVAQLQ
ncbi:hypothetical protein [Robiginitalea sp. IMCC43444]|uniref:hypothetical protein n=1 Tax=Robiginitalea sp. IMCC43444 TaxID=3459121 RepID=UPI0040410552